LAHVPISARGGRSIRSGRSIAGHCNARAPPPQWADDRFSSILQPVILAPGGRPCYNRADPLQPFCTSREQLMTRKLLGLFVVGLLLSGAFPADRAAGQADDMVDNPKYTLWANFNPAATSTYTQATKFSGPEKESVPGGVETKTITYRLLSVDKDKVVVLTTVIEEDFLSTVESAPTRITYPAKVKKTNLQA